MTLKQMFGADPTSQAAIDFAKLHTAGAIRAVEPSEVLDLVSSLRTMIREDRGDITTADEQAFEEERSRRDDEQAGPEIGTVSIPVLPVWPDFHLSKNTGGEHRPGPIARKIAEQARRAAGCWHEPCQGTHGAGEDNPVEDEPTKQLEDLADAAVKIGILLGDRRDFDRPRPLLRKICEILREAGLPDAGDTGNFESYTAEALETFGHAINAAKGTR